MTLAKLVARVQLARDTKLLSRCLPQKGSKRELIEVGTDVYMGETTNLSEEREKGETRNKG